MTKEILVQVSSHEHAASLWKSITEMFSSQSRSKILQLRSQLAREKKGDYSAAEYFSKMTGLADEMAAAGKKIEDDDLIEWMSFIFFVAATIALWRGQFDYAILAVLTAIWCKL